MRDPYPLVFAPILKDKVWGGRQLERFGKPLPPGVMIGESWELADLDSTSASGAGGGSAHSPITNGPLAGRTLRDALRLWGPALLGHSVPTPQGGFPLLVKFLDARENLSVQVHPSPAYAEAHPDAALKTECWYILDALPGSVIYKGVRPGVTREVFARHIDTGEVVADLIAVPAVPGECHNLPSGTCHALGAGVLVAEVQTPSDTTFRVFDWGRAGRELHVAQALECIDWGPAPSATSLTPGQRRGRLVSTEFFTVDGVELPGPGAVPLDPDRATVVMILAGEGVLESTGTATPLRTGTTALVPASVSGRTTLRAHAPLKALIATVP
ncbi:MAG: class I mannose-6-phosphate isomerase [Phycisphaeraceae bacterium]|nr:MAG: class I mannose-6-phosphate isomerase [Phycisphaeraceae bacterium]